MKVELTLPQMGESIAEGTVAKWLKAVGDSVEKDEAVLEITTDKIDSEIPSPESGTIAKILVEEGETVEVGAVLAQIETNGEAAGRGETDRAESSETGSERTEQAAATASESRKRPQPPPEEAEAEDALNVLKFLSPAVRSVVKKEGLSAEEVSQIAGSGDRGRITKSDVLAYVESRQAPGARQQGSAGAAEDAPKPQPPGGPPDHPPEISVRYDPERVEIIPMNTMRRKIAEHMVYSKRVSPHTYNAAEVDMTPIAKYRDRIKRDFERDEGFKLTYNAFILHAVVQALNAHPLMNSSVEGDRIIRKNYINLGVAVAIEEGLLVPVIKDADEKSLLGLAREADDLARRARERRLKPDELQDGTFTVTNPGVFGNIFGLPIINQPQVGILGVGAIEKRAVVVNDAIAIRSMMYITLSYDHRAIDGAQAARFIQEVRKNLEQYDTERAW